MRRCALLLIALAAVLSITTGCAVGPSDRPPVAVRDLEVSGRLPSPPSPNHHAPLPAPGTYDPDSLPWKECTASLEPLLGGRTPPRIECAQVRVAADLDFPALGRSLQLDLTRVGSGPAPLVVLGEPGGPPGTVRAARLATQVSPRLLESYTLIGLARRGTSPSDPLTCIPRSAREQILGADPAATSPEQLSRLLETARTAIQTCVQEVGQLLVSIGSSATADDLEQLRVALGAPVLNVLALGNASTAVLQFLQRYPSSAGRVVLDGVPDPTLDGVGLAQDHARAAEQGFDSFAADCVDRGCPLGADPRAAFTALVESLRADPLRASGLLITPGIAYRAVLEALGDPQQWPQLSRALADAAQGDGSGLAELVAPLVTGMAERPARFDAALATRCNDMSTRLPPQRVHRLASQWRERFPLFGAYFAQRLLLCTSWPVPSEEPDRDLPRQLPALLVIATNGDPFTPATGTRRAARQLPTAVLVNWQGDGHGSVGRSSCVGQLVTNYFVDGQLPTPSTLCPP